MCDAVGLSVLRLKRTEIAGVKLGMLPQGKWRELNEREMKTRVTRAKSQGVAITNYGMAIAYMNGILKRSIEALEGKRK